MYTGNGGSMTGVGNGAAVATVSASVTLDNTYSTILVNAAGGPVTLTLPAASLNYGPYTVVKVDATANPVTVAGTINGATNYSTQVQYDFATIRSNGTNYYIVG